MRAFHKRYFALGVSQATCPVCVSLGRVFMQLSSARGHTHELEAVLCCCQDALQRALALLPFTRFAERRYPDDQGFKDEMQRIWQQWQSTGTLVVR